MLPVIYLVVAIAQIQAATFATEGAARDVVRAYVIADDDAMAAGRADGSRLLRSAITRSIPTLRGST